MYSYDRVSKEHFVGKTISSVNLNKDTDELTFMFTDGTGAVCTTEGDCCSTSWIEHLEMPNDVVGATITGLDEHALSEEHKSDDEFIQTYDTVFHTNRGDIVAEFRNSSNGYYGGWMNSKALAAPETLS